MKRVGLGLCMAGLLFALPVGQARANDAGVIRGSHTLTREGRYRYEYTFSRIDLAGTLTAGAKRYRGEFHIVAGLIGVAPKPKPCDSPSSCDPLRDPVDAVTKYPVNVQQDSMTSFSTAAIRGTANGQILKGSCGGDKSSSGGLIEGNAYVHLACWISIDGSNSKRVMIRAETVEAGRFVGGYTAAPA